MTHPNAQEGDAKKAPIPLDPTPQQLASICYSFRHDFGLLSKPDRDHLLFEAQQWYRAVVKELNEPSLHPMIVAASRHQGS